MLFKDVEVRHLDVAQGTDDGQGSGEFVFSLSSAPPPQWAELFRSMAHNRGPSGLAQAIVEGSWLLLTLPVGQAVELVRLLPGFIADVNAAFRQKYRRAIAESEAYEDAKVAAYQMLEGLD